MCMHTYRCWPMRRAGWPPGQSAHGTGSTVNRGSPSVRLCFPGNPPIAAGHSGTSLKSEGGQGESQKNSLLSHRVDQGYQIWFTGLNKTGLSQAASFGNAVCKKWTKVFPSTSYCIIKAVMTFVFEQDRLVWAIGSQDVLCMRWTKLQFWTQCAK